MKKLSDTQSLWSARTDAVKAVFTHYAEIQAALNDIGSDSKQSLDTRVQANALASKMNQIQTALMTAIWLTVLE